MEDFETRAMLFKELVELETRLEKLAIDMEALARQLAHLKTMLSTEVDDE
jgi:hypothetical protein